MKPLFTRWALLIWAVLMLASGVVLYGHWEDFVSPLHNIFAVRNLVALWVLLVVLKVIHEFGHAFACKVFGGMVPEMGVFFVVFTPCAYVDASATWGFSRRKERIAVSLAGMYVESIIAAGALFVWSMTAPSFLNSCAHQIVLLAGAITVALNLNPLMRFDGYYVLSDLLNIPNLRSRSYAQLAAAMKRVFLGIRPAQSTLSRKTRLQLLIYGIAASVYKAALVLAICTLIALKLGTIGLLVGVCYLLKVLFKQLRTLTEYLWSSPETANVRLRAVAYSLVVLIGAPMALLTVPVPQTQQIRGSVASQVEARVYAQSPGFLAPGAVKPGSTVEAGATLAQLENPDVSSRVQIAEAELDLAKLQLRVEERASENGVVPSKYRLDVWQRRLAQAQHEQNELTIRTPAAGTVLEVSQRGEAGQFFEKGEHLATVTSGGWVVRCLLTAENIADMGTHVGQAVRVRLLADAALDIHGSITEVSEIGSREIDTLSLTQLYGGDIPVMPDTNKSDKPYFEIVIGIREGAVPEIRHGMSAVVYCRTGRESYSKRLIRKYRQFVDKLLVM